VLDIILGLRSYVSFSFIAFIACQANPPVTEIGWLYNEQPMSSEMRAGIQVRNNSLFIRNIGAKSHRGKYQCFAVNSQGKGESEVVNLKVQCKSTTFTALIIEILQFL
jgi:hypothetical protein